MNILRGVPGLIGKIPIRKLTLGEVIHLRFLDGFTTELVRLCECAIGRAQRAGMPDMEFNVSIC